MSAALSSPDPLDFLLVAADPLVTIDPSVASVVDPPRPVDESEIAMVRGLARTDTREGWAMVAAFRVLAAEAQSRSTAAHLARPHMHELPAWLSALDECRVSRTERIEHLLGDGENIIVEFGFAGHTFSAVIYIDHNLNTIVKDAFVVESSADQILEEASRDSELVSTTVDGATARACIEAADAAAIPSFPVLATETWPACRPIVKWLCRLLPDGGIAFERPEYTEMEFAELSDRFFSSFGLGFDREDGDRWISSFLWFTQFVGGDPLRWSPVSVEILLTQWLERMVTARAEEFAAVPDLLRAFVRFAHTERDISAHLTYETLEAIDLWSPGLLERVSNPDRPPTAVEAVIAQLREIGVAGFEGYDADDPQDSYDDSGRNIDQFMLDRIREAAGPDLDRLDTVPLPDEPLDLALIDADVRATVSRIAALSDECCDALFDLEHRTAARRLLVMVAAAKPSLFRQAARDETAASAIVWIVGKINDSFGPRQGGPEVQDVAHHFGLKQASGRSRTFLVAASLPADHYGRTIDVGLPELLVSRRRSTLIAARNLYLG